MERSSAKIPLLDYRTQNLLCGYILYTRWCDSDHDRQGKSDGENHAIREIVVLKSALKRSRRIAGGLTCNIPFLLPELFVRLGSGSSH